VGQQSESPDLLTFLLTHFVAPRCYIVSIILPEDNPLRVETC